MKKLLLVLAVIVVGVVIWRTLPGVRHRVTEGIEGVGGWTEEARRADPVGFIEYAEERLGSHLDTFQRARTELAAEAKKGEQELATYRGRRVEADAFSGEFRAAFQAADASGSWPVGVRGQSYSRDEMVAQVDLILVQRDNYDEIVAELERVLVKVGEKQTELRARIDSTKATLSTLGAKKTIAKIDKLTGEADELLREVSELLGDNAAAVEELDSPVRTVEQLTGSLPAAKPSGSATRERALSFLEGGA